MEWRSTLAMFVCIALLDVSFVGFIGRSVFRTVPQLRASLAWQHWLAIVLIWIALTLAAAFFVLPHAHSVADAALRGALLGLIIYGVYELTNFALLTDWPLRVVLIDTVWGAVLLCVAAAIGAWLRG